MCTVALKIDPKNGQALATRGHAKNALGDHHDAVTDCTEALEINPKHVDALLVRGGAKSRLGDHGGAAADFMIPWSLVPCCKLNEKWSLLLRDVFQAGEMAAHKQMLLLQGGIRTEQAMHKGLGRDHS
jgi:tetratricopeptide (TPR) repeat protein